MKLTIDDDFDFNTNKLIAKPDQGHPTKKLTTNMFAFSETIWQPRAELYLKGILKIKEKDWKTIMKAENPTAKKGRAVATEEEMDLVWDSE